MQSHLIEDSINEAKRYFLTGVEKDNEFRRQALIDATIELRNPNTLIPSHYSYAQPKDPLFSINANKLKDSQLVAAEGPKSKEDIAKLIANTVFNRDYPIEQIIAMGSCLGYNEETTEDFFDYCVKSRVEKFGIYEVEILKNHGKNILSLSGQCFPESLINSQLIIKNTLTDEEKILNVIVIPLQHNRSLQISNHEKTLSPIDVSANKDPLLSKQELWDLYQYTQNTTTLIHCNSGVSSTGHLILTFEILKHYDEIFGNRNPTQAANKILDLLESLRENRPALVTTESLFVDAIRNADAIHRFALENGYIAAPLKPRRNSIFTFNPDDITKKSIRSFLEEPDDLLLLTPT